MTFYFRVFAEELDEYLYVNAIAESADSLNAYLIDQYGPGNVAQVSEGDADGTSSFLGTLDSSGVMTPPDGDDGDFPTDPEPDPFSLEGDPGLVFAEYLRHLGTLGFDPTAIRPSRRAQAARDQFNPLMSLFRGQDVAGGAEGFDSPEDQATAFQNFLGMRTASGATGSPPPIPGTTSRELVSQFRDLRGMAGGDLSARQQAFFDPQSSFDASMLSGLGLGALGASMSPLTGGMANLPSEGQLYQQWRAGQAGGQTESFVDYIRRALGIGALQGGLGATSAQGGAVV